MKNKIINYWIDIVLVCIFLVVGITGLLRFPGFLQIFGVNINSLPKVQIFQIHHWFGLFFGIIASVHLILHWKWLVAMTKRLIGKIKNNIETKSKRNIIHYAVDIILGIAFFLVFITGIIKFPGVLSFFGQNPRTFPLYEVSIIHDWSGLLAVGLLIVHFVLHFRWIVSTTKAIIRRLKTNERSLKNGVITIAVIIATIMTIWAYTIPNPIDQVSAQIFGPSGEKIKIQGVGEFDFNPNEIVSIRPEIFNQGHFSIFDILVHLHEEDLIELEYHFDGSMNTYVIDSIDGQEGWWHEAYYDGGWSERNIFRMDHYPYKEKMTIRLFQKPQLEIESYYNVFQQEIERKEQNDGKIIIPTVIIRGTKDTFTFNNVEVQPHNLRNDVFRNDVITAIDVILSLGDAGEISYELQWYDSIGSAEVVRDYFIEGINNDKAFGRCGFVYEEGSYQYTGFQGNHIHIPADIRVINSPEYEEWFWICI